MHATRVVPVPRKQTSCRGGNHSWADKPQPGTGRAEVPGQALSLALSAPC